MSALFCEYIYMVLFEHFRTWSNAISSYLMWSGRSIAGWSLRTMNHISMICSIRGKKGAQSMCWYVDSELTGWVKVTERGDRLKMMNEAEEYVYSERKSKEHVRYSYSTSVLFRNLTWTKFGAHGWLTSALHADDHGISSPRALRLIYFNHIVFLYKIGVYCKCFNEQGTLYALENLLNYAETK